MELYSDRHIPPDEPIDLLNIAFENPRKIRVQLEGNMGGNKKALRNVKRKEGPVPGRYDPDYLVPDRSTGLSELEELRKLCPGRQWNFVSSLFVCPFSASTQECQVEIDVPYTEYQAAQPVVKSIMWPCQTVMDLVGGAVLHMVFCRTYRCVFGAESCDGVVFRGARYRKSEKWPRRSTGTVYEPGACVTKRAWV